MAGILGSYTTQQVQMAQAAGAQPMQQQHQSPAHPPVSMWGNTAAAGAAPVPGMRGGTNPSQGDASTLGLSELEKYKATPDNGSQQQQQGATDLTFKPEQFADIAAQAMANVQIDDADREAILRGDAEALERSNRAMIQQAIQQAMFASAVTTQNLQKQAQSAIEARVLSSQKAEVAYQDAASKVLSEMPHLNNELGQNLIRQQYTKLQQQYPTAPAALLAKAVQQELSVLAPAMQQQSQQEAPEYDWSSHLSE